MSEKKQKIMEAAVKFFAEKGYHATSIQEIADSLGIAKGSMYFYFNSKEDLLVQICKYYLDLFLKEFISTMEDTSEEPRERLVKLVVIKGAQFSDNRDFLTMFIKERFEVNEEIHHLIHALRAKTLFAIQQCIVELYGEMVKDLSYDAAVLFNSLSDGFMGLTFMDQIELNMDQVSLYLVDRLDDMVKGMLSSNPVPIINAESIEKMMTCGQSNTKMYQEVLDEIRVIRLFLEDAELAPEVIEEVQGSLTVLENEFENGEPQKVLTKGMVALLKNLKINEIKKHISKIETFV